MAIRFLLALLLAMLAMPTATAEPACHAPASAATGMHHGDHVPAKAPPPHACLGCVPLADWLGERVAAPILPVAIGPVALIAAIDPGSASPPALPPPRHG